MNPYYMECISTMALGLAFIWIGVLSQGRDERGFLQDIRRTNSFTIKTITTISTEVNTSSKKKK